MIIPAHFSAAETDAVNEAADQLTDLYEIIRQRCPHYSDLHQE
jgi:hypothetical protein